MQNDIYEIIAEALWYYNISLKVIPECKKKVIKFLRIMQLLFTAVDVLGPPYSRQIDRLCKKVLRIAYK